MGITLVGISHNVNYVAKLGIWYITAIPHFNINFVGVIDPNSVNKNARHMSANICYSDYGESTHLSSIDARPTIDTIPSIPQVSPYAPINPYLASLPTVHLP